MFRIFCLVVVLFTFLTQAKRRFRRVFCRQFRATARVRTLFCTSLIENDILKFSARFLLLANFAQQDSCAQCLAQVLAC